MRLIATLSSPSAPPITYVTNLKVGETTTFTNYPFNWVVFFNGEYLGLTRTKEYTLGGETDAGVAIQAAAKLHPTNFDTKHKKRVLYSYLSTPSRVFVDTDVDKKSQGLYLSDKGAQRVQMPKGLQGHYWQFAFRNLDGEPLKLDGVEFLVDVLSRKI